MAHFIGRKEEFQSLKNLLNKRSASLIVIQGRRRIGKSRLLEEFSHLIPKVYTFSGLPPARKPEEDTAQSQRDEFSRQLIRQTGRENFKKEDWGDLFWHLAGFTHEGRVLIVLDEISWMGSKDPNFLGKLKNSWDLYFKKNDHLILAICGSVSAWIEKNILSSTGFLGRESLNLILDELSLKESAEFWDIESERISAYEKLKLLSVTGGIPRYLEHINFGLSAEENIRQMCFDKSGILFEEFEKIFSDLFYPKNEIYKRLVSSLSDGVADQKTLCERAGLPQNGDISEHLEDLIKSGFISRDFTWHFKDSHLSKLSHYRLKDNYSRFYLKYILPNRPKIESGNMKKMLLNNLQGRHSIMSLQVENLVLSNRDLIKKALKIDSNDIVCDNPFFQRKTNRQMGCQIDYLIQTKHNTLYICEVKFSKNEVGIQIIEQMREKIKKLTMPRHFSYRTVLIHVNGVNETVEDSQYFSNIIDLSSFLVDSE